MKECDGRAIKNDLRGRRGTLRGRPPYIQAGLNPDVLGWMGSTVQRTRPVPVDQLAHSPRHGRMYQQVAQDMCEPSRGKAPFDGRGSGHEQSLDESSAPDAMSQIGDQPMAAGETPEVGPESTGEESVPAFGTMWSEVRKVVAAFPIPVVQGSLGEHPVEVQARHL